jgi:hypothetical protein
VADGEGQDDRQLIGNDMFEWVSVLGCECHWCCECMVLSVNMISRYLEMFSRGLLVDVLVDAREMKYSMGVVK